MIQLTNLILLALSAFKNRRGGGGGESVDTKNHGVFSYIMHNKKAFLDVISIDWQPCFFLFFAICNHCLNETSRHFIIFYATKFSRIFEAF